MEALSQRQSMRDFDTKTLGEQTLSNLLWAAYGFNRDDKRTVPSAMNRQEFEVYAVTEKGAYRYNAKDNVLEQVSNKDLRAQTGKQGSTAPLNLVYAYDTKKMSDEKLAYGDCGFISQNVYLYCASEGLATVVRGGGMNKEELAKALSLKQDYAIVFAQTIGYPKK